MTELVGPHEIAAMCDVKVETVHTWRYRGVLPEPLQIVSQVPIWHADTIRTWAENTGRRLAQDAR